MRTFIQKYILMLGLGLLIFLGCGEDAVIEEVIRPVRFEQIYATGGNRARSFSGLARSGVESNLSFKIPGNVEKLAVKVGDNVRAGMVIARLDRADYELKLQQASAALDQAKAQARNASAAYERARQLYENRNIAKSDLDAARAASESAAASKLSMEKQYELAKRQLSYTQLKAPVTGFIANVKTEINENIQAGQPVVTFTSGSEIEVAVSIPEVLISNIKEGMPVTVLFDALKDSDFNAVVTEVGVSGVNAGNTFPVIVKLLKSTPDVRSGMTASVQFKFNNDSGKERFIVPIHAVSEDRGGRYVLIVEPLAGEAGFGKIIRKAVTVGQIHSDGLEVLEGVADGDRIVTAGLSKITDGQKVRMP